MHVESFDGDVCLAGEEDNGTRCHGCSLAYKSFQLTHMWRHKHTSPLYIHSHLHSIHEFIDKSMCLVFCMKQSLIYTLIYKNTRIRYIIFLNINIQQNIFKYIHEYIYIYTVYIHTYTVTKLNTLCDDKTKRRTKVKKRKLKEGEKSTNFTAILFEYFDYGFL